VKGGEEGLPRKEEATATPSVAITKNCFKVISWYIRSVATKLFGIYLIFASIAGLRLPFGVLCRTLISWSFL
jgi:hypothetical protein